MSPAVCEELILRYFQVDVLAQYNPYVAALGPVRVGIESGIGSSRGSHDLQLGKVMLSEVSMS